MNKGLSRAFAVFVFTLITNMSYADKLLPEENRVPGGIAIINLGELKNTPEVSFNNNPVWIHQSENQYQAIIGIPLSQKPGQAKIQVNDGQVVFDIKDKRYKEQRLTVARKHSNPSAEQLKRIRKESAKSGKAFKSFTDIPASGNFVWPAQGPISSPFGLKRFFNDQPRRPHSGLDIAAPAGDNIVSPADGTVVLTGDFFFNGNAVFIDHGQGLITMYCHMQSIEVKEGQVVQQGELIGKIGSTGRVTGPHLHWTVSLNNSRVDPMLFLPGSIKKPAE